MDLGILNSAVPSKINNSSKRPDETSMVSPNPIMKPPLVHKDSIPSLLDSK